MHIKNNLFFVWIHICTLCADLVESEFGKLQLCWSEIFFTGLKFCDPTVLYFNNKLSVNREFSQFTFSVKKKKGCLSILFAMHHGGSRRPTTQTVAMLCFLLCYVFCGLLMKGTLWQSWGLPQIELAHKALLFPDPLTAVRPHKGGLQWYLMQFFHFFFICLGGLI